MYMIVYKSFWGDLALFPPPFSISSAVCLFKLDFIKLGMLRKSRRGKAPDEYMLGYADDEESIENIMSKFAALSDY